MYQSELVDIETWWDEVEHERLKAYISREVEIRADGDVRNKRRVRAPITGSSKLQLVGPSRVGPSTNLLEAMDFEDREQFAVDAGFGWTGTAQITANHQAVGGDAIAQQRQQVGQLVEEHRPAICCMAVDIDKSKGYLAISDVADLNFKWWRLETDAARMTLDREGRTLLAIYKFKMAVGRHIGFRTGWGWAGRNEVEQWTLAGDVE